MDPREHETQVLRRMTPARKLAVMRALIREACELKRAGVRISRPDLSEEEVWERTRELLGGDQS